MRFNKKDFARTVVREVANEIRKLESSLNGGNTPPSDWPDVFEKVVCHVADDAQRLEVGKEYEICATESAAPDMKVRVAIRQGEARPVVVEGWFRFIPHFAESWETWRAAR